MTRNRVTLSAFALALSACILVARSAFADAHTEGLAKEALQKAASDFLAMNYAGAVTRLKQAVHTCGAKNCTPPTKATLLRDLGTMQFRAGDKNGAAKSWADAIALEPALTLNPDYDASDVGAAWEDARAAAGLPAGPISNKPPPSAAGPAGGVPPTGGAGGAAAPVRGGAGAAAGGAAAAPPQPPEPMGEQPTGDFAHDPAFEQKEDTPLPIHTEYSGNSRPAKVVVKYKGAQMREWQRIELKRVGDTDGWEGSIPCADVGRGTMRYWIQGFDRAGEPILASGDPKHPYYVPIRDKITSEPPHFPGKDAPKSCEETDCPPGLPGCKRKKGGEAGGGGEAAGGAAGGGAESSSGGDESEKKGAQAGAFPRLWVSLSFAFDFISLPQATDVCKRNSNGTAVNSQGYYCYDSSASADFPNQGQNGMLMTGGAGTANSGVQFGNARIMLGFDYALQPNLLLGGRLGYVVPSYPGKDAPHFPPFHIEARGTYLFGNAPLSHAGLAPMGFAGLGLSEFDGHQSTRVNLSSNVGSPTQKIVDVWLTDAPFFIMLGAGVRYQVSARVALTAAIRLNVVIGGNGVLPTFGPEIGGLYAF
jgi:hypothetical protein